MTDKELADKLDARDRLLARGYEQKTCLKCLGLGRIPESRRDGYGGLNVLYFECFRCEGQGYFWVAPLMK